MLDRRGFLKFVAGSAVGTLATPVVWKSLDDLSIWSQNWPWIPQLAYGNHNNTYIRTVSKLCPSAVGTRVRLVGGRPVQVLGDSEHPLSFGGISALASTEVQMRYSPARLKTPLKRGPDGIFQEISWSEAESLLHRELGKSKGSHGITCISGDENGTMNELFSAFTRKMGSNNFFLMPGEAQPTSVAWNLMGGEGRVGYDFEKSDFILAVGANILESWGTVVCNRRAWGTARPLDGVYSMKIAYAGAVQNNTAAGADMWLPIKPGTELVLLMGIAHQLIVAGASISSNDFSDFRRLVSKWDLEKVSRITGIEPYQLKGVVVALRSAKAPLVIIGSPMGQGGSAAGIMIGLVVNLLLDRINKDGGVRAIPMGEPVVPQAFDYVEMMRNDLVSYIDSVTVGKEKASRTLILYEANPVYALPYGDSIEQLFKQAEFSLSFSCFLDETARKCDLIIPSALGLERFDDVVYPFGYGQSIYTIAKPVAEPLYASRPAGDVLISIAQGLGIDFGFKDSLQMFQAKAKTLGANWSELMKGSAFIHSKTRSVSLRCRPDILEQSMQHITNLDQLIVGFVNKRSLGTAETAIPPFNTKTITDDELQNNVLVAQMNSMTAKKYGLTDGMLFQLVNKTGSVVVRLLVFEGVVNDVVALTMGFGHTAFDTFNAGKGSNIMELIKASVEPGTGCTVWTNVFVDVVKG